MPARRRRPSLFSQWMHEYLYHRAEEKREKTAKEGVSTEIREYVRERGIKTEDGNIVLRLSAPIDVGDQKFYGMELRKAQQTLFDFSAAEKLATDKGWSAEDYGHYEFIIDQDAFLVANQQGKLTDQELDSLLVDQEPTYSLWPLEKDRPVDDDTD